MTTVLCTLVSLCVCLVLVSGLPAAKRLPHDNDDVLAGSDFLSVFMHRRMADRPNGPFEPHHTNSVTVNHGSPIVDLVKPYVLSNIYKSNKYGYAVNNEAEDLHSTTPDVNPTIDTDVRATALLTEPTTIQDIPTTIDFNIPDITSKFTSSPENHSTTTAESQTKLYPTIHQFGPEQIEEKVVVRVSSSVARHSHRTIETSTTHNSREVEPQAKLVDENLVSTLVTQEQPTITAVQRSEFAVEEAALPSSGAASEPEKVNRHEEVEGKVQEVSLYGKVQQGTPHQTLPVFEIHYANPPEALVSGYSNKEEIHRSYSGRSGLKSKEFRQLSPYSTDVPVNPTSYHSRVSSPTSASSIQFYREHNTGALEETQQPEARQPYPPQRQQEDKQAASFAEQNKPIYNQPEQMYRQPDLVGRQPKQSYGQPEPNYRQAEQNYGQPQQNYDKPEHKYDQLKQNYEQTEHNYEEPEQNYGQPERSYSIPEQSYGQREEQYSQPGQVYSQPARSYGQPEQSYGQPEQNYEVDEAVSVMTNGRAHGVQPPTPTPGKPTLAENDSDQNKFGYVVEGRNFRKYRVEERTADGFIVGEYGVVSHDDGSLRGVRYTADSDINPRLIYDTLVKFLSLK